MRTERCARQLPRTCAKKKSDISSQEFNELNLCLDVAIAAVVSEFEYHSVQVSEDKEVQHLGFLAHELRNALSSATIAQGKIEKGASWD